ncbi:MAG: hypothetical protein CHACPFDD_03682 [Phycisphaerae bacterium]|nr:hypothetical protein [Phycisphaerae bacterium]
MDFVPRVLLVSADEGARQSLRTFLIEQSGIAVFTAAEGGAALHMHLSCPVDVILALLPLPDIKPLEFVRRVALLGKPRVILSGDEATGREVAEAIRDGAADYLIGAAGHDELWPAICRQIEVRGREMRRRRERRRLRRAVKLSDAAHQALREQIEHLSRDVVHSYQRLFEHFAERD